MLLQSALCLGLGILVLSEEDIVHCLSQDKIYHRTIYGDGGKHRCPYNPSQRLPNLCKPCWLLSQCNHLLYPTRKMENVLVIFLGCLLLLLLLLLLFIYLFIYLFIFIYLFFHDTCFNVNVLSL